MSDASDLGPSDDRRSERELFDELIDLDPPRRVAALEGIGRRDPALRERLVRLLDAESESAESPRFLSRAFIAAVGEVGAERSPFGPLPRPLGHFRLLSVLGSGGMGVVFEAEQQRPRRRVALKVMRSDLTSPIAMQRFRREIETLGRLQHPGIAQIHEAGSLESRDGAGDALPYIAMQLVRGEPLDEFVRRLRSGPRQAAELLVAVCDAVHHAHQRGVVHRDLKPANILVVSEGDAPPNPTILDFGIARLTERAGPTGTIATSAGQILGTLAYMSPEQLAGDPAAIDHRTDIYALGVILYELLAGRLPLDVRDRPIADAVRVVRDEEPTRLGALDHALRGDLETIVSKAIEKDASRRYPSAQALGEELRRYLRDEPILARPTTRIERMRRFARRHRAVVVGATGTFLALSIGTIATAIFASRAVHARDDAEWLAYRSNVAAASAAFATHDVASTRRFLDDAPARFRGWEWRYLDANLDRSVGAVAIDSPLLPPRRTILPRSGVARLLAQAQATPPADWLPTAIDAHPPSPGAVLLDLQGEAGRTLWRVSHDELLLRHRGGEKRIALQRTDAEVATGLSAVHGAIALDGQAIAVLVGPSHAAPMRAWYRRLDGSVDASLDAANGGRHLAIDVGAHDLVAINGGPERLPVLWKPREGTVIPLRGHVGDVNAVAIDPAGALVATGGTDRALHLYATATGALASSAREHLDQVTCLAFTPDGQSIATGSLDHTVRVWSAATLGSPMVLNGHRGSLQAIEWTGTWLVSYDDARSLRRWPTDPGAAVGELPVNESNWGRVQFARRSPHLFGKTNTWTIRRWDLGASHDGERVPVDVVAAGVSRGHETLAASPDGRLAAVCDEDGTPSLLTLVDGRWSETRIDSLRAAYLTFDDRGRLIALKRMTIEEAEGVARPGGDLRAQLCLLPEGAPLTGSLASWSGPVLLTSPDGRRCAAPIPGPDDMLLTVADAADGRVIFTSPLAYGLGYAFGSPPGQAPVLALVEPLDAEGRQSTPIITVRSAEDGSLVTRLHGHTDQVFTVTFTPDGTRLASAGRDRVIRIWDTATWEEIAAFAGPTSFVWSLAFSPDGEVLASSGGDRTYRIWRADRERRREH